MTPERLAIAMAVLNDELPATELSDAEVDELSLLFMEAIMNVKVAQHKAVFSEEATIHIH